MHIIVQYINCERCGTLFKSRDARGRSCKACKGLDRAIKMGEKMGKEAIGQGDQEYEKCKCGHDKTLHNKISGACYGYIGLDRLCKCMNFDESS